MAHPVNVVGGGDLNQEIALSEVADQLNHSNNITAEFAENAPWQLLIRFKQGGMAILYRTGKYILRGGSSFESLDELKSQFFNRMESESIIDTKEQISYSLQNVVFLENLNLDIDLAQASIQLGLDQTEYEPEQFPGLIYRPSDFDVVIIIFSTGKVVISGTSNKKIAEEVVEDLQNELI